MDNLAAHFAEDIRNWAKDHDIELVPIPTYASWLNLIEVEFRHITEFVISNPRSPEPRGDPARLLGVPQAPQPRRPAQL